jgi:hypothetical protein
MQACAQLWLKAKSYYDEGWPVGWPVGWPQLQWLDAASL